MPAGLVSEICGRKPRWYNQKQKGSQPKNIGMAYAEARKPPVKRELKINNMSKNKKLLDDFIKYCEQHPEMRFWQSLRNWAEVSTIYQRVYDEKVDDLILKDTFYFEGRNK